MPVNIEKVLEIKHGIEIIPERELDNNTYEGFLLSDFSGIMISNKVYSEEAYRKRLRSTLAHEFGHYILHADIIKDMRFETLDDWKLFIQHVDQTNYEWFERQAQEFAGRFLVPIQLLEEFFKSENTELKKMYELKAKEYSRHEAKEYVIDYVARKFSNIYMVSVKLLSSRIRHDNLWSEFEDKYL